MIPYNNQENKEIDSVVLAKGQSFSNEEYKKIMVPVNKDKQDFKHANMSCIATCLLFQVDSHYWIIDCSAIHHVAKHRGVFPHYHKIANTK